MPAGATYDSIASTVLTSGQTSINVTGIPATYTDLRAVLTVFSSSSGGSNINMRVNADFSLTYYYGFFSVNSYSTGQNNAIVSLTSHNFTDVIPATIIVDINNYRDTTTGSRQIHIRSGLDRNGSGSYRRIVAGWPSTTAISQINFQDANGINLGVGSTLAVYGITRA